MTAVVTNLVQGPADLYIAAFGVTEPLDAALTSAPGGSYTDLGATDDGVNIEIIQDFSELEVDQIVMRAGSRLVKQGLTIKTILAEPTLENLLVAMNAEGAITGTSPKAFEPDITLGATQPTYKAMLIDGWAPGGDYRRRMMIRKVLNIENIGTAFKKDAKKMWPVSFTAHYVSSSIKPFKIVDQTA